jgi:hypothetical protein
MKSIIVIGSSIFTTKFCKHLSSKFPLKEHNYMNHWKLTEFSPIMSPTTNIVNWDKLVNQFSELNPMLLVNSDYLLPVPASIINRCKYGILQVYPSEIKANYHVAPIAHLLHSHSKGNSIASASTILKFWNEGFESAEILLSIKGKDISSKEYLNYTKLADILVEPAVDALLSVTCNLPLMIENATRSALIADTDLTPLVFYDVHTQQYMIELDKIYKDSNIKIYSYLESNRHAIFLSSISVPAQATTQKILSKFNVGMEFPGLIIFSSKSICHIRLSDGWIKCHYKLHAAPLTTHDKLISKKQY